MKRRKTKRPGAWIQGVVWVFFARAVLAAVTVTSFAAVSAALTNATDNPRGDGDGRLLDVSATEHSPIIAAVRRQTSAILETDNVCSTWFREVAPDAAEVFRSLRFDTTENRTSHVIHKKMWTAGTYLKIPGRLARLSSAGAIPWSS